jgi:DNA-binding NtrC family response regulator
MVDVSSFLEGDCAVFRTFAERLRQVARADATVLIQGEIGAGKGAAARAIHELSSRRKGPLVVASLAALAPTLVEAELFGHEEGAYTGAHRARRGRIASADGGTLVLDDVDTLPPEVQGKLVRVLQTRVVEPVGGEAGTPVDVRLICTTQRDLEREVSEGRFRKDLYFRVAVVPLEVPPLRARAEDLPALAARIIARLSAERGLAERELSPGALELLEAHPWPGNVRELENALERALVLGLESDGTPGGAAPIPAEAFDFLAGITRGVADELAERALANGLELANLERALLAAAMRQQGGNVSAAARQVGLTRRAFEYRLGRGAEAAALEDAP